MFLVAEIGLNYDGNFQLAKELIRQAKLYGADAAKFQFGWRCKPGDINYIDLDHALQLKKWCDEMKIEMFASILNNEALELAHSINLSRYKIASRTVIDNPDLCKRIIAEGKPTYVSLGMWDKKEFPFGKPDGKNLFYIYCRSKYPTSAEDLKDMPEHFASDSFYGYSDHLIGIEACILAISRGAQYIEKHFTLDKTSQVIRDHVLSATPEEFRQLAEVGRSLDKLIQEIKK
jgi:sialic acid synthase SpsE